ncbi:MAG: 4Fe-4S dicluster domain-containing protein [Candidatus Bathyarchaeia archaeon]
MTEKKTEKKKRAGILSPMWKRTASHIFTKPATTKYPFVKPKLPDDYRGKPEYTIRTCNMIDLSGTQRQFEFDVQKLVKTNCAVCARDCPAFAIEIVEVDGKKRPQFDLNKCIFCNQCVESCPRNAIKGSAEYELATTDKKSLIIKPNPSEATK